MLTWLDNVRFVAGDTTFRAMPEAGSIQGFAKAGQAANEAGELFVARP